MNLHERVHFSIDDVIDSFRWIYDNKVQSVFEAQMLRQLKEWHDLYGLKCELYLYEEMNGFRITYLDDRYWNEIEHEAKWLKVCWHRKHGGEIVESESDEELSFLNVKEMICDKGRTELWSHTARLHKYACTEEFINFLRKEGIKILLTSENGVCSYSIDNEENKKLNQNGYIQKEGIFFWKTDMRLDFITDENFEQTVSIIEEYCNRKDKMPVFLYCHEWNFRNISRFLSKLWKEIAEFGY